MDVRGFESPADVRGIVRAHNLAWREAYDGLLPDEVLQRIPVDPDEADLERWRDGLEANREGVLVAVDAGETVRGFADFRWGDAETKDFVGADEAGLKAIYVDPDHWGRGIGTALLERGLERLPETVTAVRLEVLAGNDLARGFYEARGFERTGESEHEIAGASYPTTVYAREL